MWREQLESLRVYSEDASRSETERKFLRGREVTTKARILKKPAPQYTGPARQAGIHGTVVMLAIFTDAGEVKNILVLQSLPYGLTGKAVEVARKIKFEPAIKDGLPVSMYFQLEYNFNLY